MADTKLQTNKTDQRTQILSVIDGRAMDILPGEGIEFRDSSGRTTLKIRQHPTQTAPVLQVGELPKGRGSVSDVFVSGNVGIKSIDYDWPDANAVGVLTNDGAGDLSWAPGGGTGVTLYDAMLMVKAIANGLDIIFGVEPRRFRSIIDGAEFRAKALPLDTKEVYVDLRTVAEGGSFTGTGTTEILADTLDCGPYGTQYLHTSAAQYRWFYAWRVHLATGGTGSWSLWSSGEEDPNFVTDYVDTTSADLVDDGPPETWTVTIRPGIAPYTAHIRAGRPVTHGTNIFGFLGVLHAVSGTRREIDANAGAASVYYDGSTKTNCTYNKTTGEIDTVDGDLSSVSVGDLILFSVVQGSFDNHAIQWGTVVGKSGYKLTGVFGFRPYSTWTPSGGVYTNVRIKVVKPIWAWSSDGYFGDLPGNGIGGDWYATVELGGDLATQWFETGPISYPNTMTIDQLEGTVFFENAYSRSDDDTWSSPGAGYSGGWIIYVEETPTIVLDASLGCMFQVTLTANRGLSVINAQDGQPIGLRIIQGGSGGYTLSLPANAIFSETVPSDTYLLSTTVGAADYLGMIFYTLDTELHVVCFDRGYTV